MRLKTAVAVMAVLVLAACNRSEKASVTGAYGDGVLSGQVVVQGMANNSPEGLQVSVRGTGQSAVLDSSGQFTFGSVPQGAHLDFRRGDGIDATMRLDQASGFVAIEVSGSSAKKSSRRRAASRTGESVYEFEGVIRSVTPDQLVVFTSKKVDVTIGLTPQTVIQRDEGGAATLADLVVDARVHVKASMAGTAYSAIKVILQDEDEGEDDDEGDDDDHGAIHETEGVVVSATAAQLVVNSGGVDLTFLLTPETVVRKGDAPFDPAALLPGWMVEVKWIANPDSTNTALRVMVEEDDEDDVDAEEMEIEGTVLSVGASDLLVQTTSGNVTVQTDASTLIRKQGATILLADIVAGDEVEAEGTSVDASTMLAKKISVEASEDDDDDDEEEVEGEEMEIEGTVLSVGAADLVVQTDDGTFTVTTDASTKIRKDDAEILLSAIVAGDEVDVEGTSVDATTILAKKIEVED